MRTKSRVIAAFAATCIALASGLSAGSTAQADEPSTPKSPTRYYDVNGEGPVFGTSGQDQCSKPVDARKGAWLCLNHEIVKGAPRILPESAVDSPSIQDGICSFLGCYYYYDDHYVYFDGTGSYGWWGIPLGQIYIYVEDIFSGGHSTSKRFQFESTRGVSDLTASGERLYFSAAWPQGNIVSPSTYDEWGGDGYDYPANSLINAFGAGGYTAYQGSVSWAGIAHQFWWEDPSSAYDGTWYVWWKSPKFQRQSSGQYTTTDPPTMGAEWYGSGWHDS